MFSTSASTMSLKTGQWKNQTMSHPKGKSARSDKQSNIDEELRLADLERQERLGKKKKKTSSLSPDQRRDLLNQLFYEGDARLPYLKQYYILLALAGAIASFGLEINSTAVVIGAMLLSPLMTPILGIAASLIMGWPRRAARVAARLLISTLFVFLIAYIFLWVLQIPTEIRLSDEILSRTEPNAVDLLIALSAGIASAYMLVRKEALSALPGVAIAVALVPPLCTAGMLTYLQDYELAKEAMILYVSNLAGIIMTAGCVFLFMGIKPRVKDPQLNIRVGGGLVLALLFLLIIAIPLASRTFYDLRDAHDRAIALKIAEEWIGNNPVEIIDLDVEDNVIKIRILTTLPLTTMLMESKEVFATSFSPDMTMANLRHRLQQRLGKPVNVTIKGAFGFWSSTCPELLECQ